MGIPRTTLDVATNDVLAATGAVASGKALFYGCVITGGADAASVTYHDNTAGTGTVLLTVKAAINTTVTCIIPPTICSTGIYATITGTTPDVHTFYNAIS